MKPNSQEKSVQVGLTQANRPPRNPVRFIFRFQGLFVCDGLALNPVALGPGYRSQLKAVYSQLRKSGKFHARAEA